MGLELASTSNYGFRGNGEEMYVSRALKDVYKGDTADYQVLVNALHRHERLSYEDIVDLEIILTGLASTVSNIDLSCHGLLLNTIFGMSMWNYTPGVMDALVELIVSLAVASDGKLLDSCLTMLIANFAPPLSFQKLLDMPRGVTRKEQVLNHVHLALEQISDLVPLAPSRILTMVIQRMPFIMRSEHTIWLYVENMLRLEKGSLREFLGSKMIMAVMDRLLDLDVEIEWDEVNHEYYRREIFETELEDMDEAPVVVNKKEDVHKFAEKLDSLMVMVFDHLNTCNADGRLEKVFDTLLCSFRTTVLNAYKSKFTQFTIFYACSLDPTNCGTKFARTLASIFFNYGEPHISRMSAAAYLASYLARAKFHDFEFVAELLNSLVCWCLNYCQKFSATRASLNVSGYGSLDFDAAGISMSGGFNPKAHSLFYAGCQAIMYVMCFHMWSCEDFKAELFDPLNQILNHELGPLKVCLPTILNEFLRQAGGSLIFTKKAELAESDELMFPDTFETDLSMTLGGMERLEMFFPFDPILLTKSDRFIRPHYIYWSSVNPTYKEMSDEDDDSDQENDDHDMTGSFRDSELLDECDQLNKMSVSSDHHIPFPQSQEAPLRMPSRLKPSIYPESF